VPLAHAAGADAAAAADAPRAGATARARSRYRAFADACCGFTDRCDIVRQWSAWFGAAQPART